MRRSPGRLTTSSASPSYATARAARCGECHSGSALLVLSGDSNGKELRMRVFVAGAGGAIGRRLVPQLVARGHEVVGSTTRAERVSELRALGARAVIMDGLDAAAVGDMVARIAPDVVVHQMTALAARADLKHFDDTFA